MKSISLIVTSSLFLLVGTVSAQCPSVAELTTSSSLHAYGQAVAVSGDRAVIADRHGFENSVRTGVVYVFDHDGSNWQEIARFTGSDSSDSDRFGAEVSLDGAVLAVAATGDNSRAGSVYVFRFSGGTWVQEAILRSSGSFDYGNRIGLDGDVLALSNGATSSVDVWRYNGTLLGWQFEATLSSGSVSFGNDVAVSGNRIAVGALSGQIGGVATGTVHVYEYLSGTWQQTAVFTGSNSISGSWFGLSLGLDGNTIVSGAPMEGSHGTVYMFEYNGATWVETATFQAASEVQVGYTVALDGDSALAAPFANSGGPVFEFRRVRGNWIEAAAFDEPTDSLFGSALGLDGSRAIIGSGLNHAYECPAATLRLVTNDSTPSAGQSIQLRTTAGRQNNPVMLFVVEVNGGVFTSPIVAFVFGADSSFTIQPTIPPGLAGISAGLKSFALGFGNQPEASNLLTLQFQ